MLEISRKFGTALYMLEPRSVQLMGESVGPRLSRMRLNVDVERIEQCWA